MPTVPPCLLVLPTAAEQDGAGKETQPKHEHRIPRLTKGASPLADSMQTELLLQARAGLAGCML